MKDNYTILCHKKCDVASVGWTSLNTYIKQRLKSIQTADYLQLV